MLIRNQGFGYASLEPKIPVTPHTLFCTGSTTKSFTAAGLSMLVDNSSQYSGIQWDTPISQLLREDFVLSDDWATAVSKLVSLSSNYACAHPEWLTSNNSAYHYRGRTISPHRLPETRPIHRQRLCRDGAQAPPPAAVCPTQDQISVQQHDVCRRRSADHQINRP